MSSLSSVARRYRMPAAGFDRVRWFFLWFTVSMSTSASIQMVFTSPLPRTFWVASVPALGYLLWRRFSEYRNQRLHAAGWDLVEILALFVALLGCGPLSGGVGLLYGGMFFRAVFGSTRRVVVGAMAYPLTLAVSAGTAARLSPDYELFWEEQVIGHVLGLAFSTLLMRLMLTTLLTHQDALDGERKVLSAVIDNIDSAVIAMGADATPFLRNRAAVRLYAHLGLPEPPIPWHSRVALYRGDGRTPLPLEELPQWRTLRGEHVRDAEIVIGLADGTSHSFIVNGQPLERSGLPNGAVLTATDVTARKQAEEKLAHLTLHDPLTGLANRVLLRDRLMHALQRRSASEMPLSLLSIDLDGFKTINDSLGHQVGDELLVVVAARLRMALRAEDTVARLGGDEFAVLLESRSEAVAMQAAERILAILADPVDIKGRSIVLSASIGMASGAGRVNADELLRNADLAMYAAKGRGRHRIALYEPSMYDNAVQRLVREGDLRRALERDEFHLEYQPVVSLIDGRMTGVEALLRWQHPRLGAIPPLDFIPIAESSGLIVPIGEWVVAEATRQLCEWRSQHPVAAGLTMAINVAVPQLQSKQLIDVVMGGLADNGLQAADLVVEITESAMSDHHLVLATLWGLRRLGVALALDDFGTGYSSLARLRLFPVQKVKIDRSFVQEIGRDSGEAALPAATLALAHGLGLHAVAEGIETMAQLEFLRDHGCEEAQGHLLSRAVDARTIATMLESGQRFTPQPALRPLAPH